MPAFHDARSGIVGQISLEVSFHVLYKPVYGSLKRLEEEKRSAKTFSK